MPLNIRNNRHLFLALAIHLPGILSFADASIIGVDLSGDSKEMKKPMDFDSDLVTGYDAVHRLNRYTFQKTILEEHANEVPHWIVLFCPPWYEPCQALEPIYRHLSEKWQDKINNDLLGAQVRFAAVDCATEKALCNTQRINTYPMVIHYHHREQVKIWRGKSFDTDSSRLTQFLEKELGHIASVSSAAGKTEEVVSEEGGRSIPVDFLLIFGVIAGNAWLISRGGYGSEAQATSKGANVTNVQPQPPAVNQPSSCVARSLPKEWGLERPSLEL